MRPRRRARGRPHSAPEHTHLYSSAALRQLLAAHGLTHVVFEPPLFSYDMFLIASRQPLRTNVREAIVNHLGATPDGRLVLAMQDLFERNQSYRNDPANSYGLRELWGALVHRLRRRAWPLVREWMKR